jgi:hypothetical protein
MKKTLAIGIGLLTLVFGGFAAAGITISGDNNGTVTLGQQLVVSVSDALSGSSPDGVPYEFCGGPNTAAVDNGHFGIGPLGPSEGGTGWIPLSLSCSGTATWTYSGSVTVTVPQDAGTNVLVSVAVQEWVPIHSVACNPLCTWLYNYNFNNTYAVVTPATTSTGTATTTGATTTATNPVTTTMATATGTTTQTTTPATVTQTITVTAPTATVTAPTTTHVTPVINAPSTITIHQTGAFIYITITSNDKRSLQTLCWRDASKAKQTCSRGHGSWRVKLPKTPGKRVFLLKENGKVIARKTVNIKLKA